MTKFEDHIDEQAMRFSQCTGCFYPSDIGYSSLPPDLIEVDAETYALAMSRPAGATLSVVDGGLVINDPVPLTDAELAALETSEQIRAIRSDLLNIDAQTPRAVREALLSGDSSRVQALESDAEVLREKLTKLTDSGVRLNQ
jgi:hypothetical protein